MAPHAVTDDETLSVNGQSTSKSPSVDDGNRSLPVESPCLSYWHRTTRAFKHLHSNHGQPVPERTKYCIIGSGLAGALTAWELVESGVDGKDILIVEAREAVSGASGRNAGHVRPDAFRGYAAYAGVHGNEQARKIIENEKLVFERVAEFVAKHDVPCDFHSTTTFDVCLTPEFAAYEAESFEKYKAAGGDVSHVNVYEGEEAKQKTKVPAAIAAYEWPAGSSHPAKLTQWLLSRILEQGVQLWTHCPVTAVDECKADDAAARWDVQTARGTIAAETVIHCTNAYSAYLLPELKRFVTPNRAQAHSFIPGFSLSGANTLSSTMSLRYSLHHFFSLIQRQSDGTVIFGISRGNPGFSAETKAGTVTFNDRRYNEEIASISTREFEKLFSEPEDNAAKGAKGEAPMDVQRHGEGADYFWSGIIAMTPDSVPMVGAVPGKEGQWICGGFNGHGMARIFTCAPGLVKLVRGEEWSATGLPECFEISQARLNRAAKTKIKSVW